MRFFIDTAKVEDIRKANDMGVICGVTTNPSLIAKEGRVFEEVIAEIASIVDGPISGEVKATTVDGEGMIREGASGGGQKAILLRQMGYGMATGDTFEGKLLEELGYVNDAAAYTGWLYDRANVAALEPDVIFADVSIPVDQVKQSVIYRPVAAVKNNKVMNVDFTVFERQSPRMFETLREMGRFGGE